MLSLLDIEALLQHVTYKPGWTITVHPGRFEGPWICIRAELPDAYHPERTTLLDINSPIPPCRTGKDLLDWLGWRLDRIETHERREWLKVSGIAVHDPHAEDANGIHT